MTIQEAIDKAKTKKDLTEVETRDVFSRIMSGTLKPEEIAVFLAALRDKGETVSEITGAARVMREKAVRIDAGGGLVLDTCGTGGSGINTFNISTTAAFVAAACGVKVAKHGNRSASSHCGSADVLEALGVRIDIAPEGVARCVRDIGVGFLFAPIFHSAMKYAAAPRKTIGGKTIFNILGPLSNPAGATHQLVGVYEPKLTVTLAGVLKALGSERALVVCGSDSLDEITITGPTKIAELHKGSVRSYQVTPEDFGMRKASLDDIAGGSPRDNADIILSVLKAQKSPRRDIVIMNASAALVSASKAANFMEGAEMAAQSIDSGGALEKLKKLIEYTNA